MRRALLPVLALALAAPAAAGATTVHVNDGTLVVRAEPGEANDLRVSVEPAGVLVTEVGDAELVAGGGCQSSFDGQAECDATDVERIAVSAGDGNDLVTVLGELPAAIKGGDGADAISGGGGDDALDGGAGGDSISCGEGVDDARADLTDLVDYSCERVNYGPSGQVGPIRARTGGGKFVKVPGNPTARIDKRLVSDVRYLIRRYRIRVEEAYSLHGNHKALGEHPLGLAADIVPGPGGTWNDVDRLAKWAEPRQNHPRRPFRWVGYNGDEGHGRGNHLHLSWAHSPGRRGHPVRTVWVFAVTS